MLALWRVIWWVHFSFGRFGFPWVLSSSTCFWCLDLFLLPFSPILGKDSYGKSMHVWLCVDYNVHWAFILFWFSSFAELIRCSFENYGDWYESLYVMKALYWRRLWLELMFNCGYLLCFVSHILFTAILNDDLWTSCQCFMDIFIGWIMDDVDGFCVPEYDYGFYCWPLSC